MKDDCGRCWVEGAVVVGEEDWAWGRGGLRLGMMMGGENGGLGWSGGGELGIVVGGRQRDDGVRR